MPVVVPGGIAVPDVFAPGVVELVPNVLPVIPGVVCGADCVGGEAGDVAGGDCAHAPTLAAIDAAVISRTSLVMMTSIGWRLNHTTAGLFRRITDLRFRRVRRLAWR
jgi:hypothetical protein